MEVLEYAKTGPPPPRRGFAVVGFWVAAVSLAVTLAYVTLLNLKVGNGARGVTFRPTVVQLALPVAACALCLIGWSRAARRWSVAGIALAALSLAALLVMGSRFWP